MIPYSLWLDVLKEFEERMNKDMNIEWKFYEKNLAPKWLEGDYDLHIEGNKMVMTSKDDVKVTARCHPDDDWRLQVGLDELKDRMADVKKPKIEKGHTVKPNNSSMYRAEDVTDFFYDNNISASDVIRIVKSGMNNYAPSPFVKYFVNEIGFHTDKNTGEKRRVALIESTETPNKFVVDCDNLVIVS